MTTTTFPQWRLQDSRRQRERLELSRGGKHTNRPELVEQFGYDTKYAMHMIRLGFQGIEYLKTGRLTLPVPEYAGDILRAIRRGDYDLAQVMAIADYNENELATMASDAPVKPDIKAINAWLRTVHEEALRRD